MMNIIDKIKVHINWKLALGVVLGGVGGYLYYHFIGCSSGTCPITSNPFSSIAYGMFFGGVISYKKPKKELPNEIE